MKVLVVAQSEGVAQELCAGAKKMYDEVFLVSLGSAIETTVADAAYYIAIPEGYVPDDAYESVWALTEQLSPDVLFAEAALSAKVVAARVCARKGASLATDVVSVDGSVGESRFFGGVGIKAQQSATGFAAFSISGGAFEPEVGSTVASMVEFVAPASPVKLVSAEALPAAEVNLVDAKTVVAAGRGFASEEQLDLARALCEKIGAELGCTRPLTEAETWLPRERYIGVSGQMLKPNVYVGIGVSGQMQHMVGVNQAETIFAINKDKNAPIFKQCDYGLVGDIETVLPQLIEAL